MHKPLVMLVGLAAIAAATAGDLRAAGSPLPQATGAQQLSGTLPPSPAAPRAVLDKYCVSCHNQRLKTADLMLDTLDLANVSDAAEIWEKVVRKLHSRAMPPPGRPRPDQATYDALVSSLVTSLDRAAEANPEPGRTDSLHRLNRTEYQTAIRHLLSLETDVTSLLPADAADKHGFDNMASVLSVSPLLIERYISAARKVSRLAVGLPPNPAVDTYDVPIHLNQDGRVSEDLPFGSRGGIAIRHTFPVDGEYVIRIHLHTNFQDYVRGMGAPHTLEVRLDGERIKQFRVGGGAKGRPAPLSYAGNIFGESEWEEYVLHASDGLEVRLPVRAGPGVVGVSFPREHWEPEGVFQRPEFGVGLSRNERQDGNPAVGSVDIAGPYAVAGPGDTPSRRKVFVCRPTRRADEERCAKQILSTLARRAYRRPVTERDVEALLSFYRAGRKERSFDAGIQAGLERLLVDPDFLFRIERAPIDAAPGAIYRISDLELASRLSFFLWSSIPDDELLELAARGTLREPGILEQQTRRMLADPRSKALVDNFVGQWLYVRNLRSVTPDSQTFPEFDDNLREAFQRETELFVESQLREDRSVVDLLSANYTFVNERLARHYGIPNVYGSRFRRVTFGDTEQRGGLLGHGGLLTVTSYPTRTSPVLRGKFLLENILGVRVPPPPANVPSLPEKGEGGEPASVRERLEQHRKNSVCAVCHSQMDPLGFALEQFDGIGKWRTSESGIPIDTSSALANGTKFQGLAGLRTVLLEDRELFVRTVTEKLLMYALGRQIEYYDLPTIRKIAREATSSNYRWSSIVLGIVQSVPFQQRRAAPDAVPSVANAMPGH